MKDLPKHMKQLNRKVIRSVHHEQAQDAHFDEDMPSPPNWEPTERQVKKQAKEKVKQEREARAPLHKSEEERNQEMRHRVPIFDRLSHPRPKTKPSRKKTPSL